MELSFKDKCWLVANIKRVFAPPSAVILFMAGVVCLNKKIPLSSYSNIVGVFGIIILLCTGWYALKFAYQIAKFAESNFEEVVSRRTKWRTSNVELHEIKYRFMWKTFGWTLFSIYAPIFSIIWLIVYKINV